MVAGLDEAQVSHRHRHADGAMAAHAQVAGVVEEHDARGAGWVNGLHQERSDQDIGPARLAEDGAPKMVVMVAQVIEALSERANAEVGAAGEDAASGLPGGVRIDDVQTNGYLRIGHGGQPTV
jgi:hypothetical protein